jgi:hypothetical protein
MQAILNWFAGIGRDFADLFIANPAAQIVGVVAMTVAFISFQQKSPKGILVLQMVSSTLWTVHFFLLGAYTGCIMNIVAIGRNAVFAQRDKKKWADHVGWVYGIVGICILVYVLNFTVFGLKRSTGNMIIELLPILSTALSTVGLRKEKASHVRLYCLLCSPMWLVYNIYNVALGAIATEITNMISLIIAIFRLDIKKKAKE